MITALTRVLDNALDSLRAVLTNHSLLEGAEDLILRRFSAKGAAGQLLAMIVSGQGRTASRHFVTLPLTACQRDFRDAILFGWIEIGSCSRKASTTIAAAQSKFRVPQQAHHLAIPAK